MEVKEFLEAELDLESFFERVRQSLQRIQAHYQPFITLLQRYEWREGKLRGLPISVKDCICTKGVRTTAGSRILENYVPPFDATVVARLKAAGATIVGKTTQDEFGFGTFNVNTSFSIPKNPHDVERSCGGSSGGAGCATASADFPHVALAESTGGSISCPACFCGVIGLTPTYGLVSRWGLIDYASSLDKIGVMGKRVYEIALVLSYIAGHDPLDSTSLPVQPQDYTKNLNGSIEGLRFGVPREYFEGVEAEIAELVWQKIKLLESLGASCEEISLRLTRYALPCYYIIAMCEASTHLAKFCGLRYGIQSPELGYYNDYFSRIRSSCLGEEAKRRIILGTFARMVGYREAYYLRAMRVRTKIIQEFKLAFKRYDALLAPTMPILPPRFDEIQQLEPAQAYAMDMLTVAPNLAGIPHLSYPAGFIKGLPTGLHVLADHLQEGKLLQIARSLELHG